MLVPPHMREQPMGSYWMRNDGSRWPRGQGRLGMYDSLYSIVQEDV